jgi:hypothetical protein
MRSSVLVLFMLLLACRHNPRSQDKSLPAAGDTAGNHAVSPLGDNAKADTSRAGTANGFEDPPPFNTTNYKIHTQTTLPGYAIALWECTRAVNYSCPPFLVIKNIRTQKQDTLALTHISDLQDQTADIEDITKTAGFPQLTLLVSWQGEDDNLFSEVVGYRQDTLKELFAIPNPGGMSDSLRRKDKWTLVGHVYDRDDIVAQSHDNYPIRVSLKDYSVQIYSPDTLVINYDTKAKEVIHAHRILASGKQVPFTIRRGARLHIDTFYYKQGIVRLRQDDSIRLTVTHDAIQFKVKGETAD